MIPLIAVEFVKWMVFLLIAFAGALTIVWSTETGIRTFAWSFLGFMGLAFALTCIH